MGNAGDLAEAAKEAAVVLEKGEQLTSMKLDQNPDNDTARLHERLSLRQKSSHFASDGSPSFIQSIGLPNVFPDEREQICRVPTKSKIFRLKESPVFSRDQAIGSS
jgi:hypothetical protein